MSKHYIFHLLWISHWVINRNYIYQILFIIIINRYYLQLISTEYISMICKGRVWGRSYIRRTCSKGYIITATLIWIKCTICLTTIIPRHCYDHQCFCKGGRNVRSHHQPSFQTHFKIILKISFGFHKSEAKGWNVSTIS